MSSNHLTDFINSLEVLFKAKNLLVSKVKNQPELVEALRNLNDLVEMHDAKEMVINQTQDLLLDSISDTPKVGQMSHVCIFGPPGTGKSKLGLCLAKIWNSLGLIKSKEIQVTSEVNKNLTSYELFDKVKTIVNGKPDPSKSSVVNRVKSLMKDPKKSHDEIIEELEQLVQKKESRLKRLSDRNAERIGLSRNSFSLINNIEKCKHRFQELKFLDRLRENLTKITTTLEEDSLKTLKIEDEVEVKEDTKKFVIASRAEFVDLYVGWTAKKTRKFLEDNIGKVIFIDEAYSLINSDRDSFGSEALTEIIKFMSEHPGEIIIQFAGYKEKMRETIFHPEHGNPGLERRCAWTFNIEGYTPQGLAKIFEYQAIKMNWKIDSSVRLNKFLEIHKDDFTAYGGDTEKLVFYISLILAEEQFKDASVNPDTFKKQDIIIKTEHLEKGLVFLKKNKVFSSKQAMPESFNHLFI